MSEHDEKLIEDAQISEVKDDFDFEDFNSFSNDGNESGPEPQNEAETRPPASETIDDSPSDEDVAESLQEADEFLESHNAVPEDEKQILDSPKPSDPEESAPEADPAKDDEEVEERISAEDALAAVVEPEDDEPEVFFSPAAVREKLIGAGIADITETRIVESLVGKGKVAVDEIEEFVVKARDTSGSIKEFVLAKNLLSDKQFGLLVEDVTGIKMVDLTNISIPTQTVRLIPSADSFEHKVLCLSQTETTTTVAISDPYDSSVRETIQNILGPETNVEFRYASPRSITATLERLLSDSDLGDIADDIDEDLDKDFMVRDTDDDGTVQMVDEILQRAHQFGASDIHFEHQEKRALLRMRVDGVMRIVMPNVDKDLQQRMVAQIKARSNLRLDEKRMAQNGRFKVRLGGKNVDFRVATIPSIHGEEMVLRILDESSINLTLEQLGMSAINLERYAAAIQKPHGCAFITGPTGSGKSTTLYSSVKRVITPEQKLITVEDPVEYNIAGITQINIDQNNPEHSMTFGSSLKAAMRGDPDVIVIGEIRDAETAGIAIEAALTGHFVYSSLHTNDALSTIQRLERLGVEPFLVAEATRVLVAQRLMRTLCNECKLPYRPTVEALERLKAPEQILDSVRSGDDIHIFRHNEDGCDLCGHSGYKGRTSVHEVVPIDNDFRDAIITGAEIAELEQLMRDKNIGTLRDDCFEKVLAGRTSLEELARVSA